jgi:hypothetical protein
MISRYSNLLEIINELDGKFECVRMDLESDLWRSSIPSTSGWYVIKTNTPIKVLESVQSSPYKAHIDVAKTVKATHGLREVGLAIVQAGEEDYVVYSGEANKLKARAREHQAGHAKTYCLALSEHQELLKYHWTFCFVSTSKFSGFPTDDKLLRVTVEQAWRGKHGWPILCKG